MYTATKRRWWLKAGVLAVTMTCCWRPSSAVAQDFRATSQGNLPMWYNPAYVQLQQVQSLQVPPIPQGYVQQIMPQHVMMSQQAPMSQHFATPQQGFVPAYGPMPQQQPMPLQAIHAHQVMMPQQGPVPQHVIMSQQGPMPQQGHIPQHMVMSQQGPMPQQGIVPQHMVMSQQGPMPQKQAIPEKGPMPQPEKGPVPKQGTTPEFWQMPTEALPLGPHSYEGLFPPEPILNGGGDLFKAPPDRWSLLDPNNCTLSVYAGMSYFDVSDEALIGGNYGAVGSMRLWRAWGAVGSISLNHFEGGDQGWEPSVSSRCRCSTRPTISRR